MCCLRLAKEGMGKYRAATVAHPQGQQSLLCISPVMQKAISVLSASQLYVIFITDIMYLSIFFSHSELVKMF